MTDEELKEIAFKHCYATSAAGGYIFHPDAERGLKAFARAIEKQTLERAKQACENEQDEAMKRRCYEIASGAQFCAAAIGSLMKDAQKEGK
jgi:hypothetical protein